jgi:hypothetical protein
VTSVALAGRCHSQNEAGRSKLPTELYLLKQTRRS